jgi:hypothetical protein
MYIGSATVPNRLILESPEHNGTTLFKPAQLGGKDLGIKVKIILSRLKLN